MSPGCPDRAFGSVCDWVAQELGTLEQQRRLVLTGRVRNLADDRKLTDAIRTVQFEQPLEESPRGHLGIEAVDQVPGLVVPDLVDGRHRVLPVPDSTTHRQYSG